MNEKLKIEAINFEEAMYKHPKPPLNIGVENKGIRIYNQEEEIIVISMGKRDQLRNKEKCFEVINSHNRITELEGALKNAYAIKELAEIHFKDTDEYYGVIDLCDEQIKHLEVNK